MVIESKNSCVLQLLISYSFHLCIFNLSNHMHIYFYTHTYVCVYVCMYTLILIAKLRFLNHSPLYLALLPHKLLLPPHCPHSISPIAPPPFIPVIAACYPLSRIQLLSYTSPLHSTLYTYSHPQSHSLTIHIHIHVWL